MYKLTASLIAASCLAVAATTPSSIGFVRSPGEFRVDGAIIRGNSTVFEGNTIETANARSVIQLSNTQLTLTPESRAKVFSDRTVLEKGSGILRDNGKHTLEAASLRISTGAGSEVQVDSPSASRVSVFAVVGNASVRNASGLLLANLKAGMGLSFDVPGSGASTALRVSGTITSRDGHYFLTDQTTNVTIELRGAGLEKYVGKKVVIEGSVIPGATPAAGASEVAQVTSANSVAAGAATAATTGLSTLAKAAIIGGVSAGGAVAGLAAAGSFSSTPSTSAK